MLNYRKLFFYLNDWIKGSKIKTQIKEISSIVTNPETVKSKWKRDIQEKKLLTHASQNVLFYRNIFNNLKSLSLDNFPIINKNIIRENIGNFIVDDIDKNLLFKVVTSGSTGTPFSVYHDIDKKNRNSADTIYFGKLAGFEIGNQLNYLKIWTVVNKKNRLIALAENINAIDVSELSDNNIEKLVKKFNTKKPKSFLGYASALESIAIYMNKCMPDLVLKNVSSIIAMSEGISENAKVLIKKHFGIFPVSRYSNVENGIIAQQMPNGDNEFVVNWASYNVEILEFNSDNKVEFGQTGRIVVTDYFNFAMPMIRYDTGDIGSFKWNHDKTKVLLAKVEGRKMDLVFNTSGDLVSSFTITNNMWLYPEIKQYQFIQTTKKDYLFKLNIDGEFNREVLLISEFKNYFGKDANITVEYVNEIPLLNSGKRKKVMNISNL
jgi:phenylacetate-CoA ligase